MNRRKNKADDAGRWLGIPGLWFFNRKRDFKWITPRQDKWSRLKLILICFRSGLSSVSILDVFQALSDAHLGEVGTYIFAIFTTMKDKLVRIEITYLNEYLKTYNTLQETHTIKKIYIFMKIKYHITFTEN